MSAFLIHRHTETEAENDDTWRTSVTLSRRLSKGPSVSLEAYPDNLAHHPELGVPGGSITSLSSKKGIELIKTRRAEALAKVDERAEQYMQVEGKGGHVIFNQ